MRQTAGLGIQAAYTRFFNYFLDENSSGDRSPVRAERRAGSELYHKEIRKWNIFRNWVVS